MPEVKKCYLCGMECDEDDICYGCDEYICDECNEVDQMGKHRPEDHKE